MFKGKDLVLLCSSIFVFVLCIKRIQLGLPYTDVIDYFLSFSVYGTIIILPLGILAMGYNRYKAAKKAKIN